MAANLNVVMMFVIPPPEKRLLIVLMIVRFVLTEKLVLDGILELEQIVVEHIVAAKYRLVLITLGTVLIPEQMIVPPP
jgi:hypothetical protein